MPGLFVYGTLKKGFRNHAYLRAASFLGKLTTDPCYTMYDFGGYPAICVNGNNAIDGEVYEVNPAQLAEIDRLERYPEFYHREVIATPWGEAWIYLVPRQLCINQRKIGGNWD